MKYTMLILYFNVEWFTIDLKLRAGFWPFYTEPRAESIYKVNLIVVFGSATTRISNIFISVSSSYMWYYYYMKNEFLIFWWHSTFISRFNFNLLFSIFAFCRLRFSSFGCAFLTRNHCRRLQCHQMEIALHKHFINKFWFW